MPVQGEPKRGATANGQETDTSGKNPTVGTRPIDTEPQVSAILAGLVRLNFTTSDARPRTWNGKIEALEAAFQELRIWRPKEGQPINGIPYETLIPGIARQLALLSAPSKSDVSVSKIKKRFNAFQASGLKLSKDLDAMVTVSLEHRILIANAAHADFEILHTKAPKGAPAKPLAAMVAECVGLHYYGLTGKRPSRYPDGGYLPLLRNVYEILGISAKPDSQAKQAIKNLEKSYPKKMT